MRRSLLCLALGCGIATSVLADPSNLEGGVLIAHHPSAMEFSSTPPAEGWCQHYLDGSAIDACEEQVNRIDTQEGAIWFVLAAWSEDKEWRGVEFGLGEYSPSNYVISDHGPCFPSQGLTVPTAGWPGPNEGVALAVSDSSWFGNYLPVYYFAGYPYGMEVVQIRPNPSTDFAGMANAASPPRQWAAAVLGGMGMDAQGMSACPDSVPEEQQPLSAQINCEFPVEIEVAPTNMFVFTSGAQVDTFLAGDRFTLDLVDDTVRVNGLPLSPPPPPIPMQFPVEDLRRSYGAVPYMLEHLQGQSAEDWNVAYRLYDAAIKAVVRRISLLFTTLVRERGYAVADAERICLDRLGESELVESASAFPGNDYSYPDRTTVVVHWRGQGPSHVPLLLVPERPRRHHPHRLTPEDACHYVTSLSRLQHAGRHCLYLLGNGHGHTQERVGR